MIKFINQDSLIIYCIKTRYGENMKCPHCGLENPDDFKYCHECGTYLAPEFDAYNARKHQNGYGSQFYGDSEFTVSTDDLIGANSSKVIIIGYLVAVLFGWGGILLNLLLGAMGSFGFFGFVGFVFPGFLLNSSIPRIRKHAYIQMIIMIVGFALTLYMMFRAFL